MVAEFPRHHVFTRRSADVPGDVVGESAAAPVGDGAGAMFPDELGDERVARVDGGGEMVNQGLEKRLARPARGSLDDRAQRCDLVARRQALARRII